jgi:ADP-ribose pyrophosphatase YjhB (NUDIX family)
MHRTYDGVDDLVLPGGTPRAGESIAGCARRELSEETGVATDPARVAFILAAVQPGPAPQTADIVFIASDPRQASSRSTARRAWSRDSSGSPGCTSSTCGRR